MSREREQPGTAGRDDEALAGELRRRAEQVPPEVAERLAHMRRAAVTELDRSESRFRSWGTHRFWVTGLAGAAAALALTLALLLPRAEEPGPEALLLADADELAAMSNLELLEELEFLAWLEQEQLDAGQD